MTTTTTATIRELLADETRWCTGNLAEDSEGDPVDADSQVACRWCLWGAMMRCYPLDWARCDRVSDFVHTAAAHDRAIRRMIEWIGEYHEHDYSRARDAELMQIVTDFNDETEWPVVRQMLDDTRV